MSAEVELVIHIEGSLIGEETIRRMAREWKRVAALAGEFDPQQYMAREASFKDEDLTWLKDTEQDLPQPVYWMSLFNSRTMGFIRKNPSVTVTPARMPANAAYVGGGGAQNNRGEHAGS